MDTMYNLQAIYGTPLSWEGVNDPPAYLLSLFHHWKLVLEDIEDALQKLHDLAMEDLTAGHNVAAEKIFLLLIDPVKEFNDLRPSTRIGVLDEIASYYEKAKNHPQLLRVSKILLTLPFSTRKELNIKSKAQQRMAQSILDTVPVISSAFADRFGENVGPPVSCPALHQAVEFGDREVFKIILKKTCERTVPGSGQVLLPSGSDNLGMACRPTEGLDNVDAFGRTALFLAVVHKAEDMCDDLISAGAVIQKRDTKGHTLLEIAAENGLFETVKRMLSWAMSLGQDFLHDFVNDVQFDNTSTPLQAAAAAGHSGIVRLLLENGAEKDARRLSDNKTAAELAADNRHEAIAAEINRWQHGNPQDEDFIMQLFEDAMIPGLSPHTFSPQE
jgi:ankyrin repeat protein